MTLSLHTPNVPPPSANQYINRTGVFHAAQSDGSDAVHFFISDAQLYNAIENWLRSDFRYEIFAFTLYSSATNWIQEHGATSPLSRIITTDSFVREIMKPTGQPPQIKLPPPRLLPLHLLQSIPTIKRLPPHNSPNNNLTLRASSALPFSIGNNARGPVSLSALTSLPSTSYSIGSGSH
jgi:hypothetical protein